jgi:hypothetical protein
LRLQLKPEFTVMQMARRRAVFGSRLRAGAHAVLASLRALVPAHLASVSRPVLAWAHAVSVLSPVLASGETVPKVR